MKTKPVKWCLNTDIPEVLVVLDHPNIHQATSASVIYGDDLVELLEVYDLEPVEFKRLKHNET